MVNCSIFGLTLERERGNAKTSETEVRETAGKIEGIGDVLSDGSKRFLGKSINLEGESRGQACLDMTEPKIKDSFSYQ